MPLHERTIVYNLVSPYVSFISTRDCSIFYENMLAQNIIFVHWFVSSFDGTSTFVGYLIPTLT